MLADEYRRQAAWRSWSLVLDALPSIAGQTVLDLGCAIGDQAALLAERGARVLGYDANDELLAVAQSRKIAGAELRRADLQSFTDPGEPFDGVWCSFAAAYFVDLPEKLAAWTTRLRPGGWVALTEVDNLFGHEPVGPRTRSLLDAYADEALELGRYDFYMGRKLAGYAEKAGLSVVRVMSIPDQELAFDGPAAPDVIEAWGARFERMRLLQSFCADEYEQLRSDFLHCLTGADHRSPAKVYACIATRRS
jgi:SAM-dependent methyltransferase